MNKSSINIYAVCVQHGHAASVIIVCNALMIYYSLKRTLKRDHRMMGNKHQTFQE